MPSRLSVDAPWVIRRNFLQGPTVEPPPRENENEPRISRLYPNKDSDLRAEIKLSKRLPAVDEALSYRNPYQLRSLNDPFAERIAL